MEPLGPLVLQGRARVPLEATPRPQPEALAAVGQPLATIADRGLSVPDRRVGHAGRVEALHFAPGLEFLGQILVREP